MSAYTDDDVQTVARAMFDPERVFDDAVAAESATAYVDDARAVLDAVAPAIVARAKAEALRDAAFYVEALVDRQRLRDRANEIEAAS